ncbi:MAG: hypothetical protein HS104_40780 [Polyangiaceae bacterium]|nr:hypothetical protein [Polyangiaceae bacterium]MCL4753881.1 hypothetical protein [Myxococcales bacterium]
MSSERLRARPFLWGLFVVSASVLALEVLDTRLLSVLTWYSLAFLVIAMGLFGLTAGAVSVYLRSADYDPDRLASSLAKDALWMSLAVPASYVLLLIVPLRAESVATVVPLFVFFAGAIALPFYPAGKVVAAALTRSPLPVGRVYAVDLLGAALGAPLCPLLLERLGGGSAILAVGALAALGSYCFARAADDSRAARTALIVLAGSVALSAGNAATTRGLVPLWVKGRAEARDDIVLERWNSHSRVMVTRAVELPAALWGKGERCGPRVVLQRGVEIDAHAATPLYLVGNDLEALRFIECDVTNAVHRIRPDGAIAIIGVGGSRDIQAALLAGHAPVVGIELNRALLDLLKSDLGRDTGIASRPEVRLIHDEARSQLARHPERYRVIQASLIDTWAATGAGAHALGENGLYTVEAFRLFLERLEPGGVLTVSRWASIETPRMVALAVAALYERGVPNPREHIALLGAGPVATLLVGRDPLTADDITKLGALAGEKGFLVAALPDREAVQKPVEHILGAVSRADLDRRTLTRALDVRPTTDDRPFFFNVVRVAAMTQALSPELLGLIEGNLLATRTLGLALFASLVLVVVAIALPLRSRARPEGRVDRRLVAALCYFALIGVGFMLAEIALLQRLSLVLGHPSYSLMVVLASLVSAMGVGSFISDRLPLDEKPWCYLYPVVLALLLGAVALGWEQLVGGVAAASTPARIGFAIAICGVLGIALGSAFPAGMRLVKKSHQSETPWFWGINGVGSVLSSSLAILLALSYGLTTLLSVAAALYVLLVPAVAVLVRSEA